MNPIALVLMVIGIIVLLLGVFWAVKRSRTAGMAISLLGVSVAAIPFFVSLFLAR